MVPKQPPKRTPTRPGLGIEDAVPRLDSAELKKVRDSFEKDVKGESPRDSQPDGFTPPPASSREARASIRREEDDMPPDSVPRSDRFVTAAKRQSPIPGRPVTTSARPPQQPSKSASRRSVREEEAPVSQPARNNAISRPPGNAISRPPSSKPAGRWTEEAPSGPRSRRPLTVDSVGDTATRLARNTVRGLNAPKVVASQAIIASAPIDSRTAFVLSLVDGSSDVPAIVDATGMPEDEVIAILARLARLGLISVP